MRRKSENTLNSHGKTKERKRSLFNWTGDINMDDTQRWLVFHTISDFIYGRINYKHLHFKQ